MRRTPFVPFVAALLAFTATAAAQEPTARTPGPAAFHGKPTEQVMRRGASVDLDVRDLPPTPRRERFRPERHDPKGAPIELPGGPQLVEPIPPILNAPAPAPTIVFEGLDREELGFGTPPDTNGDAGPTYYIQTVNAAIGIYRKSDGFREAGFTFDALMSQGNFGNLCDTDNFGDPVVLYDSFEDRWVLTDFAFQLDGAGNVSPPNAYQCFAVSKTGDPITGGWNFYSIETLGGLGDYPKFGIWPDGLYMTTSMFDYAAAGSFQNPRVYAFNKAQMYAGDSAVQGVAFDGPAEDFTILPANARLQTGTPPLGAPNYYVSTWQFLNALTVYKFHVDWARISLSTFTGPDAPLAATSWPNANVANAPQPGTATTLDTLQFRAMMQNQYTNISGGESLWVPHTVRRANTTGFAAPRWYQVNVTGGTVAANLPQAATWDPDAANVLHRFMPSLALDRAGNLALGYSTSSSTAFPSIRYAGRLAGDPVNTFSQTEQTMFTGTASQTGSDRWGDYSAMTLDPDGCTFWYTNEYANPVSQAFDKRWKTKIGSFKYSSCVPVGNGGTVSGTVTALVGGAPISGATVQLGARSTTTNGSGFYSFTNVPAGTYPSISASKPGFVTGTSTNVVVTDAGTTTRNFALAAASASACLTDTTQSEFQTGAPTNVDLVTSAGNVVLARPVVLDQHADDNGFGSGYGFNNASLAGQTFTPAVGGTLVRVDAFLFCASCSGANPNIILEVRTTSGGHPVMTAGGLLASSTITGSAASGFFTFNYAAPATLVAGTQYGLVVRLAAARTGTQAWLSSSGDVYAGGRRKVCTTATCADPTGANNNSDLVFKAFMNAGYAASGFLVSAVKDANPAVGSTPTWSTINWTATVPVNTTLRFQVAGSTAAGGPWNFVGPDGTAATFYTVSGGSLAQFNGKRYLRYKAYLTTTNSATTSTLNDVTLCFANIVATPDLSMAKSDGGASVAPGGTVAYTLTYANGGTGNATGVVITDVVPANTTFNAGASTAGWACSPNNNAGSSCTLAVGGVTAGGGNQTATYAVTVVNPVGAGVSQIANTASIADDATHGADPTPANNSGSDTTPLTGAPDLSLAKSDGGASVAPGGTVSYTLTYANGGNRGASGVALTETVPANTTFNAGASTAGWGCTPNNNAGSTCTLSIGTLAAGGGNQTATYAVTVVNPVGAGVTQISNTASISNDGTNGADPNGANNSGSDTTPLTGAPDLSMTKSDGGASVAPGGTVSYTLTYANSGNRGASGVTLTDTVPANTTFNAGASSAGWSCTPNNNAGSTCTRTVGTLAAGGGNQTSTYAVTVVNPVGAGITQISNTASIADDATNGTDPTPANNSGSDTTPLTGAPDLSVTKSDGGASVAPGGTVSYTLTYANSGNRGASGVALTETVPTNTTFNAGASTAGWSCTPNNNAASTCTLSIGTLAAGGGNQTATFAVTVVNPVAAGVSQISNTASIANDGTNGTDPNTGNNSGSDTTPLAGGPDLSIAKSDGGVSVVPGNSVSYTLTYANGGNRGATGVTLTDVVPANTTFNAGASTAGWSCAPNNNAGSTCTLAIGGLAAGSGPQTATFAVTVTNPVPGGTTQISNTASIADDAANGTDPNGANNSGSDTTPLTGADLSITKDDGATLVNPSTQTVYAITASNAGPATATGATVTDTFPAGLTCSWTCAGSNGGSCGLGAGNGNINETVNLPAGGSVTYTATCAIPGNDTGIIVNTATVATPVGLADPTSGNNSATDVDKLPKIFKDGVESGTFSAWSAHQP